MDTRLILIEGLPSTGKTTNARFIQIQLERNDINAKWIHEIAMPQPLLFFDEAGLTRGEYERFLKTYTHASDILNKSAVFRRNTVSISLPELRWYYLDELGGEVYQALLKFDAWNFPLEVYKEFALEKWAHFTEQAMKNRDEVYIIDSAIFQFQIFSFLLRNRPFDELSDFVGQLADIVQPLDPRLIFLRRECAEASINNLENDRGTEYLDYIWQRDKAQPYYADKPAGAEGFKRFLRDYAVAAERLYDAFPARKSAADVSDGDWTRVEDEMLSFLGVSRITRADRPPPNGVYANGELGFTITVDGMSITDPNGETRPLYPKTDNEYFVDWLPTVLRFEHDKIIIAGSQTGGRWTVTGTVFKRDITR